MVLSLELLDLEVRPSSLLCLVRLLDLITTERGEEEAVVGLKRCPCVENAVLTIPLFLALGSA